MADLGVNRPVTGLSGPPGGNDAIINMEIKKVEQSIQREQS